MRTPKLWELLGNTVHHPAAIKIIQVDQQSQKSHKKLYSAPLGVPSNPSRGSIQESRLSQCILTKPILQKVCVIHGWLDHGYSPEIIIFFQITTGNSMVGESYHRRNMPVLHWYFLDKVDLDAWARTYLSLDEPFPASVRNTSISKSEYICLFAKEKTFGVSSATPWSLSPANVCVAFWNNSPRRLRWPGSPGFRWWTFCLPSK